MWQKDISCISIVSHDQDASHLLGIFHSCNIYPYCGVWQMVNRAGYIFNGLQKVTQLSVFERQQFMGLGTQGSIGTTNTRVPMKLQKVIDSPSVSRQGKLAREHGTISTIDRNVNQDAGFQGRPFLPDPGQSTVLGRGSTCWRIVQENLSKHQ